MARVNYDLTPVVDRGVAKDYGDVLMETKPEVLEEFLPETSTPEEPEEYSVSSADNANIDEQFIPDNDEDNYNFPPSLDVGIGVYNTAKLVTEGALTTLPAAERVFGFNAYNDGSKYSGFIDFFSTLGSSELSRDDFMTISKTQNDQEFANAMSDYANNYVLTQDKIVDHLNNTLNLDITNVNDFVEKYKGNQEVADAVTEQIKYLEQLYKDEGFLVGQDFYEDDENYYIKNFKELPFQVNTAFTEYGDIQIPGLGIYKIDEDGKGAMIANSPFNIGGSGIVGGGGDDYEYLNRKSIGTFLDDQGFTGDPANTPLYGNQFSKSFGHIVSIPAAGFALNPGAFSKIGQAKGFFPKIGAILQGASGNLFSKAGAKATGIGTLPVAGSYYGFFD
jgi:hypothetical protein